MGKEIFPKIGDATGGWGENAQEHFNERGFTCTVWSKDSKRFAFLKIKAHTSVLPLLSVLVMPRRFYGKDFYEVMYVEDRCVLHNVYALSIGYF